jgi:citrate synthase
MGDSWNFEMSSLEGLERDLTKAIRKCPEQAKDTLDTLSKDFKKSAKKRADSELKSHERTAEQKNKAIKRKWGSKTIDEGVGMVALIYNSARHFHLIENGHNLVRGGRVVGFVAGKHIMENTRKEYSDIVPERFEKMVDDVLKGCDL